VILAAIALGATLVILGLQRVAGVAVEIAILGPVLCVLAVVFIFRTRPRSK
jgi:hypothetical protein